MNKVQIEKYAQLIVKKGVNLQKDQLLVITSPIETAEFARLLAETAYKEGAGDVVMKWEDAEFDRVRFMNAPEESFDHFPEWEQDFYLKTSRAGAAYIYISAQDPEILSEVEPERMARWKKSAGHALKEYIEREMSNQNRWTVVSAPVAAWSSKVFPGLDSDEANEKLWETILKTVRADLPNPLEAWEAHKKNLKKRIQFMHDHAIVELHFKNSLGTNLTIKLPKQHLWAGGSMNSTDGTEFILNMPTEEIYTVPLRTGVNGKVVASMPLNYNGTVIEDFWFVFKDGKVVEFDAKKGRDTLRELLETDEGSAYLGEVALVPHQSPISNLGILFYNTLFDENASCHIAFGKAYPSNIKNHENYSLDELVEMGVNDSLIHVDFMFGTSDLSIIGKTASGEVIQVFQKGNFAFKD